MTNRGELMAMQLSDQGAASLQASGAQINETFSQEGLRALWEQAAVVLPQYAVKPGDNWQGRSQINSPAGTLLMTTKYTYRGTEQLEGRVLERIDLEITVGFGDGPNALGLDVNVADQKNCGSMYFDAVLGQFVRSEIVQQMTMETQLGEHVHRQQLNTQLRMKLSEATQMADRTAVKR
jgi:hypothetical protein